MGDFTEAQPLIQQKWFIGITTKAQQQQPNLSSSSTSLPSQLSQQNLVSQNRQHVNHNNNLSNSSSSSSSNGGSNASGSGLSKSHSNLYLNNNSNNGSNNLNNNNLLSSSTTSNANISRQSILPPNQLQQQQQQLQQQPNQQQLHQSYPSSRPSYNKHVDNKALFNGRGGGSGGGYPGPSVNKTDIHSKSGTVSTKLLPPPPLSSAPHVQSPTLPTGRAPAAGSGTMLPPSTSMMPNGRLNDSNFLTPPVVNGVRFSQTFKKKTDSSQGSGSSKDVTSILSQMTKTTVPNLLTEISATPRNPNPFYNLDQQQPNRHKYSIDIIKPLSTSTQPMSLISPFSDEPLLPLPLPPPIKTTVPPLSKST